MEIHRCEDLFVIIGVSRADRVSFKIDFLKSREVSENWDGKYVRDFVKL